MGNGHEDLQRELETRLAKLRRAQRVHRFYLWVVFVLGVSVGYAVAEAIIDPIVVITSCDGIRT